MACPIRLWFTVCFVYICIRDVVLSMTWEEKSLLKEQAREMFYHAYHAYMDHAYPADELMPLSCKGRYRDIEPNRGDVDDALGNFSLTLVDTLDTLVVLADYDEFERAVKKVIRDVSFDNDVVVSVFETNIRVLGGLLSAHILGSYLQERLDRMTWYRGELLTMARDVGFRLLPAFNTTTGVPHPRINLRYGLKSPKLGIVRETCTACAGTMILEFAALSRLTGEPIFEEKARVAMDYLWKQRHRTSDLMGTVLNIHNGDWIRRDSGVGAGIDSYYEYCLKAYILLGDDVYLERFNKHYSAVMKYISQGPLLVDVHMHRPHTNSRNFMDALLAFWPGLQVLKGDIKPAIETHEMLYQVMQRHNFLPEAFTVDFQVHWGQHPLRPEFVESTYFLYKATNDPYYLEVGKKVLDSLQKHARVPCGFAAVKDVRTGSHEDRMDSFVLAETLKYLYLLFANKDELTIEVDDFVFTTEAHLLPLSLARLSNVTVVHSPKFASLDEMEEEDFTRSCPNTHYLFPEGPNFAQSVRLPLKNLVEGVCPTNKAPRRRTIHATEFQASSRENVELIKKMGITVNMLSDGGIQLVHNASQITKKVSQRIRLAKISQFLEKSLEHNLEVIRRKIAIITNKLQLMWFSMAETQEDAEEGMLFMQEMIELSKNQNQQEQHLRVVYYYHPNNIRKILKAGPAQFGLNPKGQAPVESELEIVQPLRACTDIHNNIKGKIAIVERGDCMFIEKARYIQNAGAVAGIVLDNHPGTSAKTSPMFAMSGDGKDDIRIPMVFLFSEDGGNLLSVYQQYPDLIVGIADISSLPDDIEDTPPKSTPSQSSENTSNLSDGAKFVDSKPNQQSLPKFFGEDEFATAQKRVQLLLSKLHNLQQIKVDLDELLALTQVFSDEPRKTGVAKSYQNIQRKEFQLVINQLMKKEKILEIDQDVQGLLTRLRELVQLPASSGNFQTFGLFLPCPSPHSSLENFLKFITVKPICMVGRHFKLSDFRKSNRGLASSKKKESGTKKKKVEEPVSTRHMPKDDL